MEEEELLHLGAYPLAVSRPAHRAVVLRSRRIVGILFGQLSERGTSALQDRSQRIGQCFGLLLGTGRVLHVRIALVGKQNVAHAYRIRHGTHVQQFGELVGIPVAVRSQDVAPACLHHPLCFFLVVKRLGIAPGVMRSRIGIGIDVDGVVRHAGKSGNGIGRIGLAVEFHPVFHQRSDLAANLLGILFGRIDRNYRVLHVARFETLELVGMFLDVFVYLRIGDLNRLVIDRGIGQVSKTTVHLVVLVPVFHLGVEQSGRHTGGNHVGILRAEHPLASARFHVFPQFPHLFSLGVALVLFGADRIDPLAKGSLIGHAVFVGKILAHIRLGEHAVHHATRAYRYPGQIVLLSDDRLGQPALVHLLRSHSVAYLVLFVGLHQFVGTVAIVVDGQFLAVHYGYRRTASRRNPVFRGDHVGEHKSEKREKDHSHQQPPVMPQFL